MRPLCPRCKEELSRSINGVSLTCSNCADALHDRYTWSPRDPVEDTEGGDVGGE